ncbi:MAG: hypothetical protein DDT30_01313 [Dehalococcoidia bacterium]|nr:hypothetical protein [Bacillota bacterium]
MIFPHKIKLLEGKSCNRLKSIVNKSIVPLVMAKAAVNAYLDGGGAAGNATEIQSVCICFSAQEQKEGMAANNV